MTTAMERRLDRLEARQPAQAPWRDPFPVAMAIFRAIEAATAATKAGRPFSRLPVPELSPEAQEAVERAVRDSDRMHSKLMAEAAGT
jgi:hypothetical protein